MRSKRMKTYGVGRGSRKVGKRTYWFWEAFWRENNKTVIPRFGENVYGDGIAKHKAKETRRAAEERLLNLKRSS